MGKYVCYTRVSTENQQVLRQDKGIEDYCKVNNIKVLEEHKFSDKITGKTFKRENYTIMKTILEPRDTLIILDLDRLGRNWELIKEEWKWFMDNQINIIVVNMPLLNSSPNEQGEVSLDRKLIQGIVFDLMCYLSQKEVEKISQRTKESLKAKKEQGIHLGRAFTQIDNDKFIELYNSKRDDGSYTYSILDLCREFGVSKPTIIYQAKRLNLARKQKNID